MLASLFCLKLISVLQSIFIAQYCQAADQSVMDCLNIEMTLWLTMAGPIPLPYPWDNGPEIHSPNIFIVIYFHKTKQLIFLLSLMIL